MREEDSSSKTPLKNSISTDSATTISSYKSFMPQIEIFILRADIFGYDEDFDETL